MLLHLLILLSILLVIKFQPVEKPQKKPHLYVPSYVYTGAITPPSLARQSQQRKLVANTKKVEKVTDSNSTEPATKIEATPNVPKPAPNAIAVGKRKHAQPSSLLAASSQILQQEQRRAITNRNDEEPILMIGDTTHIADPFIKLLARSLSAHFRYPDNEGMLGIKGRALIVLTIHPEGYYSDVELVKSSENQNLDAAALFAVNTAPHIVGASTFIKQPKRFVVGFIFE